MRGSSPRSVLCEAAAAICLVAASAPAAERSAPDGEHAAADATITFRGRSASVGIGFLWGASTVEFQGKTYRVRADGFVLGGLGSASIEGVGKIFGLTKIEDLNGDYTAEGQPQFEADLGAWNLAPDLPDSLFTFTPAAGAEQIPVLVPRRAKQP